jgi:hypothetical protein
VTSEECDLAFDQLEHAMNEAGLAWVTTQVAEDLRFGKTRTKKLSVREEKSDRFVTELLGAPRRSNVTVSATEPYTSEEKLRMLVRALEQTTVAIDRMEGVIRNRFNRMPEAKEWRSIQLVRSDEPDREAVAIHSTATTGRSEKITELDKLLKALRERI